MCSGLILCWWHTTNNFALTVEMRYRVLAAILSSTVCQGNTNPILCTAIWTITAWLFGPSLHGYLDHHCMAIWTIVAWLFGSSLHDFLDHRCMTIWTIVAQLFGPPSWPWFLLQAGRRWYKNHRRWRASEAWFTCSDIPCQWVLLKCIHLICPWRDCGVNLLQIKHSYCANRQSISWLSSPLVAG